MCRSPLESPGRACSGGCAVTTQRWLASLVSASRSGCPASDSCNDAARDAHRLVAGQDALREVERHKAVVALRHKLQALQSPLSPRARTPSRWARCPPWAAGTGSECRPSCPCPSCPCPCLLAASSVATKVVSRKRAPLWMSTVVEVKVPPFCSGSTKRQSQRALVIF